MRLQQLEVFSSATNAAIVKAPGRRFPGVLLQADTLRSKLGVSIEMTSELEGLVEAGTLPPDATILWANKEITDWLADLLGHYQEVLTAAGEELPFDPAIPEDG